MIYLRWNKNLLKNISIQFNLQVTLKFDQGHQNWYDNVKRNKGWHHAMFGRPHLNSFREKAHVRNYFCQIRKYVHQSFLYGHGPLWSTVIQLLNSQRVAMGTDRPWRHRQASVSSGHVGFKLVPFSSVWFWRAAGWQLILLLDQVHGNALLEKLN